MVMITRILGWSVTMSHKTYSLTDWKHHNIMVPLGWLMDEIVLSVIDSSNLFLYSLMSRVDLGQ